jgi:hypothetical protein
MQLPNPLLIKLVLQAVQLLKEIQLEHPEEQSVQIPLTGVYPEGQVDIHCPL